MTRDKNILIAGGGIGGLTTALSLLRQGFEVNVFEQAPKLEEVGAGIQLSGNAIRVLLDLGLGEKLKQFVVAPEIYSFRLHDTGEVLQEIPLGAIHLKKHGAPYYQMHRADIHSCLVGAIEEISTSVIHLNKIATGYVESDDRVVLNFADGTQATGDVLIGADGLKSVVRGQILASTPVEYTGQVAWRVLIDANKLPDSFVKEHTEIWVGPHKHAVLYYLRGGDILNFVGLVDHEEWSEEGWAVKYPWEDMKADFEGWHGNIQAILDAADKDQCFRWALNSRAPVTNWSSQRVTLLGDAAHPTLPYLAQGTAMAIEDAAVLTRALLISEDVSTCLQAYQKSRIERTTRIVNESAANKKLFHMENTEALKAAFASRNMSSERSEWLFSYNALTAELATNLPLPIESNNA